MKRSFVLLGASLFPLLAFAAPADFSQLIDFILQILTALVPVLMGLALLLFFWGLAKFISESADAKKHADGRQMMIWGVVVLAIMLSYLAIVQAAQSNIFGSPVRFPSLPTNSIPGK